MSTWCDITGLQNTKCTFTPFLLLLCLFLSSFLNFSTCFPFERTCQTLLDSPVNNETTNRSVNHDRVRTNKFYTRRRELSSQLVVGLQPGKESAWLQRKGWTISHLKKPNKAKNNIVLQRKYREVGNEINLINKQHSSHITPLISVNRSMHRLNLLIDCQIM